MNTAWEIFRAITALLCMAVSVYCLLKSEYDKATFFLLLYHMNSTPS
jgi:hypothetical protein